jgi:uncharacterized linocin/CFP29 family protein
MQYDPQVPWTDEQWARVNAVIQEEAARARVAARFLPLVGPLPPDTDFVRRETVIAIPGAIPGPRGALRIDDRTTIQLATLQVEVRLRGRQLADPELTSALELFRRAANGLARLEDAVAFNGFAQIVIPGPNPGDPPRGSGFGITRGAPGPANTWEIKTHESDLGLRDVGQAPYGVPVELDGIHDGQNLVSAVSRSIGQLEARGYFGPFALVLDQLLFLVAETPDPNSLVLPQDRIIPFLGGGPLLRCSALDVGSGVVVALGGAPVELVVGKDMSVQFLQVTPEPHFLFRVYERIVLRIKELGAISALDVGPPKRP